MSRTTPAQVASIIETDPMIVGTSLNGLQAFIDTAEQMVTDCCTKDSQGYTDAKLELIERWLAAHFYAMRDRQNIAQMEAVGPFRESYQRTIDLGLSTSMWGQMAMRLDTAGGLAAKDNKVSRMRDVPIGILPLHPPRLW